MDTLSTQELLATVEQLINTFEDDENQYYVCLELVFQLQAELTRILADDV